MTYERVIPRDLFNEGDLLKCLGRLTIALEDNREHNAATHHPDSGESFTILQDASDGSISCPGVQLLVEGAAVPLYRPLNARERWSLWARFGYEDVRVFDLDGNLSPEFWVKITEAGS